MGLQVAPSLARENFSLINSTNDGMSIAYISAIKFSSQYDFFGWFQMINSL